MSVRFEYSIKYPRIPHSPHPKPVSFRTFDTPVSRQELCLSTMDDVSAGPRATEGPSPWHRRRVVGRESVGCFMIRCIFRAYGSGKWRRGTLFYTDPCVLSLTSLAENAGLLTFLNRFDRLPVRGTIQRKIFCNCQFRLHSYDTQSPLVGIAMVNVVDV